MIKVISSVSVGYLVLLKSNLPLADYRQISFSLQEAGYNVLTDNKHVLFCKHNNPNRDFELVHTDFEAIFEFKPHIFPDLQYFLEFNGL